MSETNQDSSISMTMEFRGPGRATKLTVMGQPWIMVQHGVGALGALLRPQDGTVDQWLELLDQDARSRLGARWMFLED